MANNFFNNDSYAEASANLKVEEAAKEIDFSGENPYAPAANDGSAVDAGSAAADFNPYTFAAKVGINAVTSMLRQKAALESQVADAKLQRAQANRNRGRLTDIYSRNTSRLSRATRRNDLKLTLRGLEQESNIAAGFAGSGLSGESVNDINTIVSRSVAEDKYMNKKMYQEQSEGLNLNYNTQMEDINLQASQIGAYKRPDALLEALGWVSGVGLK